MLPIAIAVLTLAAPGPAAPAGGPAVAGAAPGRAAPAPVLVDAVDERPGADAPGTDAPDDEGFFARTFPFSLDEELHPALADRVILLYAVLVLFPEGLPALWAPAAVTGRDPEGYLGDLWLGLFAHLGMVVCCPPTIVVDVPWLLPLFVLRTFDRALKRDDARAPAIEPARAAPMRF